MKSENSWQLEIECASQAMHERFCIRWQFCVCCCSLTQRMVQMYTSKYAKLNPIDVYANVHIFRIKMTKSKREKIRKCISGKMMSSAC